jgi:predicted HD superfamily hydrolase involved in NAD metabolism
MSVEAARADNRKSDISDVPSLLRVIARESVPETLAHEERTAVLARELAVIHGVDPDRAELAALVHDVAAHYSDVDLAILAERFDIPVSYAAARLPTLLHGSVGAELLRREYGVRDEELLDAVRDHVVGGPLMSRLAKIVFIADKVEPGRDNFTGGLDSIRDEARRSLDRAMLLLYSSRTVDLVARGLPIDENMVAGRNMLLEAVPALMRDDMDGFANAWTVKP